MKGRIKLFPEHFKEGTYSGTGRDFEWYETLVTKPRGGEDILEFWYSNDPEESEYLNESFQRHLDARLERLKKEGWDPSRQFAYCIGQSHLDLGWMWHLRQGVAKAETTFNKLHDHFKLFAPFTFTGSQPAQYLWIKQHSPSIWANVVDDVARRRHEPQGVTWSEADGRMPSGEAWARHCLYGQLFYARNFGKLATIAWFPDSFGYANNLPQIFSKAGAKVFMTAKLGSNKQTKWPFWAWNWRAPDGSEVIGYCTGSHEKIGPFGGFTIRQPDSDVQDSYANSYKLVAPGKTLVADYTMDKPEEKVSDEDLPVLGVFFGEGDGGHGPQGVEVATCRGMVERGVATWSNSEEFFEIVARWKDRLPAWDDEIYYEFHRGSLTTQTLAKRMNRYFEWTLPFAEALATIAMKIAPEHDIASIKRFYTHVDDMTPSTTNPIEQVWQNVLLMQFHDVLPGTSIPEVYDECFEFWSQDMPLVETIIDESMKNITEHGEMFPRRKMIRLCLQEKQDPSPFLASMIENIGEVIIIPVSITSASASTGHQVVDIPANKVEGFVPFALIQGCNPRVVEPVQLVSGDAMHQALDARPARWCAILSIPAWSTETALILGYRATRSFNPEALSVDDTRTLNEEITRIFSQLNPIFEKKGDKPAIHENEECIHVISGDMEANFDKKSGNLSSIKHLGETIIDDMAGLHAYHDKPYREDCWNLMLEWWKHEKPLFSVPNEIFMLENGPVKWTVRVVHDFGSSSKAMLDYSFIKNVPGFHLTIGMDFHETETLVKYRIPIPAGTTWSVAETPYATARRRNEPVANHDIPRWEKWMHTFVTLERDDESRGIAVVNAGKYGFDTLDGHLGISIIRGPLYPGTNIVAWARDERKLRNDAGMGEPPTHADQGIHVARFWIVPYTGTWRDGHVHSLAHAFNMPAKPSIHVQQGIDARPVAREAKSLGDRAIEQVINEISPTTRVTWIKVEGGPIEVCVLKHSEKLPLFMDPRHGKENSLVIRAINNSDVKNDARIILQQAICAGFSSVIEVNLLEQPTQDIMNPRFVIDKTSEQLVISGSFKPHEIRTFKLLP